MKQRWKFFTSATRYPSIREKVSKWKEGLFFFFLPFLGIPIDPIRQNREEKEKRKGTG
jgi:hypothetical protein